MCPMILLVRFRIGEWKLVLSMERELGRLVRLRPQPLMMRLTRWGGFVMEAVRLSNGIRMRILGYGVYQVTKQECERCVLDALKAGYRSLDTAQSYHRG